ncbi:hypothetical protein ACNSOL_12410 (plasmid) [Aliarcobacter lanthieri]|uniref:hypothetical protein n=1 Tax=Aliarcobacter lanthieri TaxID=1355374 RepID=UPI003AAD34EB
MTRDEFLFKVLEMIEHENCSPLMAISKMIKSRVKETGFSVNARGSSFISFEANSLDYAIKQFLKVRYPSNENTILGNGVHSGADFGYKFFLETGKYPKRRDCLKMVIEKIKKDYQFIDPDKRADKGWREIASDGVRNFKAYWWEMLKNIPIESEKSLFMEVPDDMLQNPDNKGKINFSGTLDRIFRDINGKIILSDLKTSKKRISAGVEHSKELSKLITREENLLSNLKLVNKEIEILNKKQEKQEELEISFRDTLALLEINIFSNLFILEKDLQEKESTEKRNEKAIEKIKNQIEEMNGYIVDYKLTNENVNLYDNDIEKVQSPKRLITKLDKLIEDKKSQEEINFDEVLKRKVQITTELDEVSLEIEPLRKEYFAEVKKGEIEAAKSQYGTQLAFYAMLYMIIHKVKIDKLRVEIVVKNKKPFVQVIEWDLDETYMRLAYEKIQTTVSTIEGVLSGIDPMILFRTNSTSYIGSDTNKLLEEINQIISERESI